MPLIILGITISYLLGSIPTAYIFGRIAKGIDIRNFGSGNVGATNAMRVLGRGPGITVLLLDIIKGMLAVLLVGDMLLPALSLPAELLRVMLGLSCVCGHNWTVFLNFKGGKGIATTLGVLLGLAFRTNGLMIVLGLAVLTWLLVVMVFRVVSVASVISAAFLPIYMLIFRQPVILTIAAAILSFLTVFRHKSNIRRVIEGKEKRLF